MKETLELFYADLRLQISIACKHLRNKAYPEGGSTLQRVMSTTLYHCVLADELEIQLGYLKDMTEALKTEGETPGGIWEREDGPINIYEYCLGFFETTELPLGSSTDELKNWFGTHPERQQMLHDGLNVAFPNIDFLLVEEDATVSKIPSESDLFKARANNLLRNIEDSNALEEFNQQMQKVRLLLTRRVPIGQILSALNETRGPSQKL